ncbi:MAG: aminotransferase class III-fold pyridoxal phosphate-dependent enzyme [Candidatus Lokiarchaeota archaeon]|nr:aminotransferase class III-fold pyridoxal phosphate-dependent enzyme [Candidatus Lokiarchaeota archaeon]
MYRFLAMELGGAGTKMNKEGLQILKELGLEELEESKMTNEYWTQRASKSLALTTQQRDVYGCLDHTRGSGLQIYDIEGTEYLDVTGGVAVRALGLRFKPLLDFEARINDVIHELPGMDFDAIPQTLLAEAIADTVPGKRKKRVVFTTSGGRAVEGCMKSAMDLSRKQRFVGFRPAFHGRTGYALSLTASNSTHKSGFPQGVDVIRVAYPYCYRCPYGQNVEDCNVECVEALRYALEVEGNDIAATVMEPLCGEGGLILPPAKAVKGMFEVTKENGGYFISDEIQAGMGRTGNWCAIELHDVIPDYVALAKALGGGYPMGASVGPSPMYSGRARHSETFSAEPKMALISLWLLKYLEEHNYLEKNAKKGEYLLERLHELKDKHDVVGDVRGAGLMVGLEFVKDRRSKEKAPGLRNQIIKNAVKKQKLWILGSGQNCIRLTPSYVITEDEMDDAVDRLDKAISEST